MHQPSCHKGAFESAVVSLAQRTAAVNCIAQQSAHSTKHGVYTHEDHRHQEGQRRTRKPQNFCPWVIDDDAPQDKK